MNAALILWLGQRPDADLANRPRSSKVHTMDLRTSLKTSAASKARSKNFPGRKWLRDASYLTDEDRARVLAVVEEAAHAFPGEKISVRPPSYTGEPHPIAMVMHEGFIFRAVYR